MIFKIIAIFSLLIFLTTPKSSFADSKIQINEFLAHPSSGNKEWVEFYNPDNIDLSNYYLDDDTDFGSDNGSSTKKSLSSINKSDQTHPYLEFDSFLNNGGDYVVLFAQDGSIVDQYQYTKDPGMDISIGRSPDGNDNFSILAETSKGSTNGQVKIDPSPDPTPTQTTSSQSTSQTTSQTSTKPSSPTPIKTASKSPSPTSKTPNKSPSILGDATKSSSISSQLKSPIPSTSPDPISDDQKPQSTKVAYYMGGLGTILIATSLIFYFMAKRKTNINKTENEQDLHNQ